MNFIYFSTFIHSIVLILQLHRDKTYSFLIFLPILARNRSITPGSLFWWGVNNKTQWKMPQNVARSSFQKGFGACSLVSSFYKRQLFFPLFQIHLWIFGKRKNSVFFQGFVPNWENSAWEQFGVTSAGGNWSFGEKAAPSTSLSPILSLLSGWEAPKVQLSPLCLSKLPAARKYIGRNDPKDALIWFIPQYSLRYSLRPGHRQGTDRAHLLWQSQQLNLGRES